MSKLSDAAEEAADATDIVAALRSDVIIQKLILAFRSANFAKFDPEALLEELGDIGTNAAFDTDGFPLDSTDGIMGANRHRFRLQALRDRLITLNRKLRESTSKVSRTHRLAVVHLRQHESFKGSTQKAQDEIIFAVLREIADVQENMKLVLDAAKESLAAIDDKSKTLDAWFALHKQYIFMTANRGPQGDEETHQASKRLGKRREP